MGYLYPHLPPHLPPCGVATTPNCGVLQHIQTGLKVVTLGLMPLAEMTVKGGFCGPKAIAVVPAEDQAITRKVFESVEVHGAGLMRPME